MMRVVMCKLKDLSFGQLLTFFLVYALVIMLITQYHLGKEPAHLENTQSNMHSWLDGDSDNTDSLVDKLVKLKSVLIRAEREIERLKLARRANECPQLPYLKLPHKLNAALEYDNYSALPDQRVSSNCQLIDCFDFSRCSFSSGFPVFVYERSFGVGNLTSGSIDAEIFQLLKTSPYYTAQPEKACLYIVIVGSVARTRHWKSKSDIETDLHSLPYWKGNGQNHLLLYLKTDRGHFTSVLSLNINTGYALVAQSTFLNNTIYRHGFNIVVPPSTGPLKGDVWHLAALQLPARRKYLLSFQAEHADHLTATMAILRDQLHDISREARDFLIELYLSKFQYLKESSEWLVWGSHENRTNVLRQSTFALIVGSNSASSSWDSCHIRLLEALQSGAIPVILSSKTMLPFNDVIDWRKAAIILSQARLPELNVKLRTITNEDILDLRRQGRFLWETHLSTTDVILKTVLATLRTRLSIPAHHVSASPTPSVFSDSKPPVTSSPDPDAIISLAVESPTFFRNLTSTVVDAYNVWNTPPGSFRMFPSTPFTPVLPSSAPFKNSSKGFELIGDGMGGAGAGAEFKKALGGNYPVEQFTIVILTYHRELVLIETIKRLVGLKYLNKVVVVWNSLKPPSSSLKWPDIGVPVHVVKVAKNSLNNRFIPYDVIETDAILSIDDDIQLKHEEILLCFRVWREARDQIVGIPARFHAWDSKNQQWRYGAGTVCELSIILTGAAFYHKYYGYLYTHWMPQVIRDKVDEYMNCEDLAMNFLVSHITRKPPIKVTSQWQFLCRKCSGSLSYDKTHFSERHKCLNFFVEVFGYMPLLRTQSRAVSLLFKTGVSRLKSQCYNNV